jgi:hypothetical protein
MVGTCCNIVSVRVGARSGSQVQQRALEGHRIVLIPSSLCRPTLVYSLASSFPSHPLLVMELADW